MRIIFDRKRVYQAMCQLIKVVGKTSTLPDVRLVQIKPSENANEIILTCSNIESTLSIRIPAEVPQNGHFALYFDAKEFRNFLGKGLADGDITMDCAEKGGKVTLEDAVGVIEIHQEIIDEKQSLFDYKSDQINKLFKEHASFYAENIFHLAKRVQFAASTDEARPVLNGIQFKDGAICAVNGFVIANIQTEKVFPEFILPATALSEFLPLLDDESTFVVWGDSFALKNKHFAYGTQLISGNFPDWQAIMPKKIVYSVRANVAEMKRVLRVPLFIGKQFGQGYLRLNLLSQFMVIKVECGEFGNYSAKLDYQVKSAEENTPNPETPFLIGFKTLFISEMLQHIASENVTMKFNTNNAPGLFESEGDGFKLVIMPARLE